MCLTVWARLVYIGSLRYVKEVPESTKALNDAAMALFPTAIPVKPMT